jgi:putative flippase GtrA
MKRRLFRRTMKFLCFSCIGTTTFAMQLFFTVLFTEIALLTYYISHAIALTMAWLLNFFFNMRFTFSVQDQVMKRMRRFAVLAVLNSTFNWIFVFMAVERMRIHYFIAIVFISAVLSIMTFMTEEVWVFSKIRLRRIKAGRAVAE